MENQEIFLLYANSFITPYKQYYAFDLIVPYWDEIIKYNNKGRIVVLDMVKNEIMSGKDELSKWLKNIDSLNTIPHKEINTVLKYQEVIQYVKNSKLYKESAFLEWSREEVADPWIISSAAINNYTIVTLEVSSGSLSDKNPNKRAKIPDVAKAFGVDTINLFEMMRRLGIKIE